MMRLSDQELELVSAKGVMLVSTKGPMEGASKVGETEGAMQDSAKDASRDSVNLERKAKSKTTNAKTGHFKNFFMC